jgi:hypothetical protein
MYCHLLTNILKGILVHIRKLCFNYLWKGKSEYLGSHLVNWKTISTKNCRRMGPKEFCLVWKSLSGKIYLGIFSIGQSMATNII